MQLYFTLFKNLGSCVIYPLPKVPLVQYTLSPKKKHNLNTLLLLKL